MSTTTTVKQLKEIPGLVSCVLEHQVTSTKATFKWDGPKIPPLVWQQVLAFFKWTQDTYHSESQVRLFLNHKTREWKAWAFPQKARTSMTAHEITAGEEGYDQAQEQRAQFSDVDGWIYFGTVHHHCGMSAFQSGVDETNEKLQDGLHITIGKLYDKLYDMHCRLYISGHRFEPKMNWFWSVEEFFASIPQEMQVFLVDGVEDRIARTLMCQPPPKDFEFPEQWKKNVIEVKPVVTATYQGGLGHGVWRDDDDRDWERHYNRSHKTCPNIARDLYIASVEVNQYFATTKHKGEENSDPIASLAGLKKYPYIIDLMDNLYRNDVTLEALVDYMIKEEQEAAEKQLASELAAEKEMKKGGGKSKGKKGGNGNGPKENGIPDYEGIGGHEPGTLHQ